MSFFGKLFGAKSGEASVSWKVSAAATDVSAEPHMDLAMVEDSAAESGLSADGEKAVTLMALTQNFKGLAAALKHSSPKVRAFVVSQLEIAGRIEVGRDGSISFEITSSGQVKRGKLHPEAVRLLNIAAKDKDPSVASEAAGLLEAMLLG